MVLAGKDGQKGRTNKLRKDAKDSLTRLTSEAKSEQNERYSCVRPSTQAYITRSPTS